MAVVYAESPGAAFAASSNLDQQRVANYLQSIQQNRNAQQQSWQAAAQMAAARQAQDQQQQTQMIQLAQHAAQQKQAADQFAQNLEFNQASAAETGRKNLADESYRTAALGRENASLLAFHEKQKQDKEDQQQEAALQESLARQLNQRSAITTLRARLDDASLEAAFRKATGEGFSHLGDPDNTFWATTKKTSRRRSQVMQQIAADASELPVDFSDANSVNDYAAAVVKAIDEQLKHLPNPATIKNLHTLVEDDGSGNYRPVLRLNPLLGGGAQPGPVAAEPGTSATIDPFTQYKTWLRQQSQ